jgi:tRNA(fMet)-specific endonuclease VapC
VSLFVLDTDILTLFERGDPVVAARVAEHDPTEIGISVVTVEEHLSGWYAQLRQAKGPDKLAWAYRRLASAVRFLSRVRILDYEEAAIQVYEGLKRSRLKVGKMDLQIAATALQHGGTVVTRNVRDFQQVPGLKVEDWSKSE